MKHSERTGDRPHRRRNALTGEWILVSPRRTDRPWGGRIEKAPDPYRPRYAADCYLCPGNPRAGGARNPAYRDTFVFTNDFPALVESPAGLSVADDATGLFGAQSVGGTCRVICFSPRHDLTLAQMSEEAIAKVVGLWSDQIAELGQAYRWVQVFENKGEMMGCSNAHPHGQIWATDSLPNEPAKEDARQREYVAEHGAPLLVEYARAEMEDGSRVVAANDDWLAAAPWWAMWPFETLVLPRRRHIRHLPEVSASERLALAALLKELLGRYDALFHVSFPYTMGWHGAPTGGVPDTAHWQLHAHFYPPLLRSATIRKFMVGYEMLAEAQRDITPEEGAERLRKAL